MNRFISVLRGVIAAAAAGCVALLGLSFGPTLIGYESFIVTSGSMGKAVPTGSAAVTRMVDVRAIRTGDVISFQTESASRITHRVISVMEEEGQRVFETKGDANPLADPQPLRLISGEISRVQWSVPFAGYLVRYARTPVGGILLFAVPILGLIIETRKRADLSSVPQPKEAHPMPSSLTLSCPHCGVGVALSLVPLQVQKSDLTHTATRYEEGRDHISIPSVTGPGPEAELVSESSTDQTEVEPKQNGYREWNFPLELSDIRSNSKNTGSPRG